jgi:hypothetical protein
VIKNTEKEDHIELAQFPWIQIVDARDVILYARLQEVSGNQEVRVPHRVDCDHGRASPFQLEAEPTVPSANVEHAFPAQILGYGKLVKPPLHL